MLQHSPHPLICSVVCRHAFSVRFPMGPVLRKELGEQLVAAGLVGAAMTLFEELELWDALILCYRLLQKNVQAEELVLRRLKVSTLKCAHKSCSFPFHAVPYIHTITGTRRTQIQRLAPDISWRGKSIVCIFLHAYNLLLK